MNAKQLFDDGKVQEAIQALGVWLREHPTDSQQRIFLFELLCFAGQYDRAEKQLGVLSQASNQTEMGAILYYSALHGEKTRNDVFQKQEFPQAPASPSPAGTLNGKPFLSIRDADPEIGARLEVFAAGSYLWIPFEHIISIRMDPPRRLRDTLWAPATVLTGPSFKGTELGEVLIPAVYPFSWRHPDETIWLGRATAWEADEKGTEYPMGQKLFLADGDEVPLLEIRTLEFAAAQSAPA